MQQDHTEAEEYEESNHRNGGFFGMKWLKDSFRRGRIEEDDYYDEDEEETAETEAPAPVKPATIPSLPRRTQPASALRIDSTRRCRVTVRRSVHSFEDVRRAVDELREGVQQVINLEQTPVDMCERLIDFLNGSIYAIDGSVEKIGEHVFLFTPQNVTIDIEDSPLNEIKTSFFDKD